MFVQEVSAGSREQATGIDGIAKAVAGMQQVTHSIAASAEEAAGSSEEMAAQAEMVLSLARDLRQAIGAGRA